MREAKVGALADLPRDYPALDVRWPEVSVGPAKVFYVILLETNEGLVWRGVCLQFDCLDMDLFRSLSRDAFAELSHGWSDRLRRMVNSLSPDEAMACWMPKPRSLQGGDDNI